MIDADGEFMGDIRPQFTYADFDFAAHTRYLNVATRNYPAGTDLLCSGSLYFANNDKTEDLVYLWDDYIKRQPDYGCGDQDKLKLAFNEMDDKIKFKRLSAIMCCMGDKEKAQMEKDRRKILIYHHQLSHKYKKLNGEDAISLGRAK